jgi:hypothetical protein
MLIIHRPCVAVFEPDQKHLRKTGKLNETAHLAAMVRFRHVSKEQGVG